jgi:hypothetical protein
MLKLFIKTVYKNHLQQLLFSKKSLIIFNANVNGFIE